MEKKYLIKPSTVEDALENWVWTNDESKNGYINIYNPKNKKSIIAFKRTIDNNFVNFYNCQKTNNITEIEPHIIVINEYFRVKLGIEKNKKCTLEIKTANLFHIFLNSNWNHPNPSVSLSYKLNIISLILAIVSIILGVLSMKQN